MNLTVNIRYPLLVTWLVLEVKGQRSMSQEDIEMAKASMSM